MRAKPISWDLLSLLESITSGIIPGVDVVIDMEYSSDDFRLMSAEDDYQYEDDVIIQIVEATLTIPMGEFHPKMWSVVEKRMSEKEQVLLHFHKAVVDIKTIPAGTIHYINDIYPTAAELPNR